MRRTIAITLCVLSLIVSIGGIICCTLVAGITKKLITESQVVALETSMRAYADSLDSMRDNIDVTGSQIPVSQALQIPQEAELRRVQAGFLQGIIVEIRQDPRDPPGIGVVTGAGKSSCHLDILQTVYIHYLEDTTLACICQAVFSPLADTNSTRFGQSVLSSFSSFFLFSSPPA